MAPADMPGEAVPLPGWRWLFPAALLLCLPALWNGFPFLFPDSMDYLRFGPAVAQALAGQPGASYGLRSPWYTLGLLPLHGYFRWVWPVVVVQAWVVAWTVRLCLRATSRSWSGPEYLLLVALLVAFTPVGWVLGMIIPDIFTGVLILGSFWLGPGWPRLSPGERWMVAAVTLGSLLSHLSNAPLLLVIGLFCWLRHGFVRSRPLLALLGLAWLAQLCFNALLYRPLPGVAAGSSRTGDSHSAPLVLARFLADGPALRYIHEHGQQANLALYRHRDQLRPDIGHFLWDPQGPRSRLMASDPAEWNLVCQQQTQVIVGTLMTYPLQQLTVSLSHLFQQLATFGLNDFDLNLSVVMQMPQVLPTLTADFLASRQASRRLPIASLNRLYEGVVVLSLLALAAGLSRSTSFWRHFCGWIGLGLVVNAAITGILSAVAARYQSRVVWLLPMLALLFWLSEFRKTQTEKQATADSSL